MGSGGGIGVAGTRPTDSEEEGGGGLVPKSLVGEQVPWFARGVWKEGQVA